MAGEHPPFVANDKRSFPRYSFRIPVTFRLGEHRYWAITEDISIGGLFLHCDHPPRIGEELEVCFEEPVTCDEIVLRGRVVHRRGRTRSAILGDSVLRPSGAGVSVMDFPYFTKRKKSGVVENDRLTDEQVCVDWDKESELDDREEIKKVFDEQCESICDVFVRRVGGSILYRTYFKKIVRWKETPYVHLEPVKLNDLDRHFETEVPFHVQFKKGNRCYCFTLPALPQSLSVSWSFPLPQRIASRELRSQERYSHETIHPLTVEFPDPVNSRLCRVKNVLDVSYGGLAFKSYPGQEVYSPGTKLHEVAIYAFDFLYRVTDAVVTHNTLIITASGEVYRKVGIAFPIEEHQGPADVPRIKEDEVEEISGSEEIVRHLKRVAATRTKILGKQGNTIYFTDGTLDAFSRDDALILNIGSFHFDQNASKIVDQHALTFHYLLFGTCYFFTSRIRNNNEHIVLDLPERVYRARRRKILRIQSDNEESVRISFLHPIIGKVLTFHVGDLSVRGLSFECDYIKHLLWKDLMIRGCEIIFGNEHYALGAVVVRSLSIRLNQTGVEAMKCGVEFVEPPDGTDKVVSSYVFKRKNPNLSYASALGIERLWELFYKSGFIYPSKNDYVSKIRERIDQTWSKLLAGGGQEFYKNLVFREGEEVIGTASALQVYEHTWMFQHLASCRHPVRLISKHVMLGLAQFLMEHWDIQYLIMYFRKENTFTKKIFAGFLDTYPIEEHLSLTRYNFLQAHVDEIPEYSSCMNVPVGTEIRVAGEREKQVIENYFWKTSTPLVVRARGLTSNELSLGRIASLYEEKGLRRERICLVAHKNGQMVAFSLLESTSPGMNLSGLLSAFSVWDLRSEVEDYSSIKRALIRASIDYYRRWGEKTVICLSLEDDVSDYLSTGLKKTKEYFCFTASCRAIRSYYIYVEGKYTTFEARKRKRGP